MDELREREHDEARTGDVLQRRADDCDLRRVRHASGRLSSHHAGRSEVLYRAQSGDRSAVRMIRIAVVLTLLGAAGCATLPQHPAPPIRVLVLNMHAGKDAAGRDNVAGISELVKSAAP